MATLRNLLDLSGAGAAIPNQPQRLLYVYDTSTQDVNNGGACCLWTVPDDVTWVAVEMWGGGGGGAGTRCGAGFGGGSGGYGRKIFDVEAGQEFTICAAGSTCCRNSNAASACGFDGNPSYMCRNSVCCLIAPGGSAGIVCCCWNCGLASPCRPNLQETEPTGFTFSIPGLTGGYHSACVNRCYVHQSAPGSPFAHPHILFSRNNCNVHSGRDFVCGNPVLFPGGGAYSAMSTSSCCCGGVGAGGMVTLYYYSCVDPNA